MIGMYFVGALLSFFIMGVIAGEQKSNGMKVPDWYVFVLVALTSWVGVFGQLALFFFFRAVFTKK